MISLKRNHLEIWNCTLPASLSSRARSLCFLKDFHQQGKIFSLDDRPRRWSIFRAMRCRWFIFQQRCDTDYFLEKLNIAIVAIIFLDHRERLFFDYFAHFRTDYFAIIHWLTGIIRKEVILEIRCSVTSWLCTTG